MDDPVAMHVLQGLEHLKHEGFDLTDGESQIVIAVFKNFENSLFDILEHDVQFFVSFEGLLKADDVLVPQVFEGTNFSDGDLFDDWIRIGFLKFLDGD